MINKILESLGYTVDTDYRKNISKWLEAYKGSIDGFHSYQDYNGSETVTRTRKSLGMPKKAAEDWADTLFNDNVQINLDEDKAPVIELALEYNDFRQRLNELIELTFALSTGAMVVYSDAKKTPTIDYIDAQYIYPLETNNGQITSCAFGSYVDKETLYLNIHKQLPNGKYQILNKHYKVKDQTFKEIKVKGVLPVVPSDIKMFHILKPALANNIEVGQPMGMSIYANAFDELKAVDMAFNALDVEVDNGQMKLFLKTGALGGDVDKDGNPTMAFDSKQSKFHVLSDDEVFADGGFIHVVNPELRTEALINSLATNLNLYGRKVGLGDDYYAFKDGSVYTNTSSVISSNSRFYKTRMKHAQMLERVIIGVVHSIYYIASGKLYNGDVTIDFDDSIVEDSEAMQRQSLLELNAGIISKPQYFMETRDMTEEQAIEFNDTQQRLMGVVEDEDPEGIE